MKKYAIHLIDISEVPEGHDDTEGAMVHRAAVHLTDNGLAVLIDSIKTWADE